MQLKHTIMDSANTREYFELTVEFDPEERSVEPVKFELVKNGVTTDITDLAQYAFDLDKIAEDVEWESKITTGKYRSIYDEEMYENDTHNLGRYGKSMFH